MYFLRAATSIIIIITVTVPTEIYITSSTPVTSYYTTSTVQLIPTTIVKSLPVTHFRSIPTLIHAPLTITVSTDLPVPTTTSIPPLDYNPPHALWPIYSVAILLGSGFLGLSFAGNVDEPHRKTTDSYIGASIVVLTISFLFSITSLIYEDEELTVKGNIWGNLANLAADIVTMLGGLVAFGWPRRSTDLKRQKRLFGCGLLL
jgi:hypothetical protein